MTFSTDNLFGLPSSGDEALTALSSRLEGLSSGWDTWVPASPVAVPEGQWTALADACAQITPLLESALQSLGGSVTERHIALGLNPERTALYKHEQFEQRTASAFSRPDAILTDSGFKILEFNFSSALGGQPFTHVLPEVWADLYPDSMDRIRFGDPLREKARFMRDFCRSNDLPAAVAIIGFRDAVLGFASKQRLTGDRFYLLEVVQMHTQGLRSEYFELPDFSRDAAALSHAFPTGIQRFVLDDESPLVDPLDVQAMRTSDCTILSPHSSRQLNDKRLMALISAGHVDMTEHQRAVMNQYLPWTRLLNTSQVDYRGTRYDLSGLLRDQKDRFLLKPPNAHSGAGVVIGNETSPEEWDAAIATTAAAGGVVQEFVRSVRHRLNVVHGATAELTEVWVPAVLSPYMLQGRAAGGMARVDLLGRDSVTRVGTDGYVITNVGTV